MGRLLARREQLTARSTLLRDRLGVQAQRLSAPMSVADNVIDGAVWLRAHPEWPVGVAAVLLVLRPRRAVRWAGRGVWAWQLWRRMRPHVLSAQRWWDRSQGLGR